MKKYNFIWIALFALTFTTQINSQSLKAGIIGGFNFSNLNATISDIKREVDGVTNFGIGAVILYDLNYNLAVQIEPMYISKGGIIKKNDESSEMDIKANYIELPILFKASIGGNIRPFVSAGTTIGFFLNGTGTTEVSNLQLMMDVKPITNTIELGLTFGAGVGIDLWKGHLFVEGRYSFSLANQIKDGTIEWKLGNTSVEMDDITADQTSLKNSAIMVLIGFSLPIF